MFYLALYTIQMVLKQLNVDKQENSSVDAIKLISYETEFNAAEHNFPHAKYDFFFSFDFRVKCDLDVYVKFILPHFFC